MTKKQRTIDNIYMGQPFETLVRYDKDIESGVTKIEKDVKEKIKAALEAARPCGGTCGGECGVNCKNL